MKSRMIPVLIAMTLVMGGCAKDASAPADNNSVFEKIDLNSGSDAESGDATADGAVENADVNAVDNNSENAADDSAVDTDDYTEQIKAEVCAFHGRKDDLIITEGMENGSYDILVHISDDKELRGWAYRKILPNLRLSLSQAMTEP